MGPASGAANPPSTSTDNAATANDTMSSRKDQMSGFTAVNGSSSRPETAHSERQSSHYPRLSDSNPDSVGSYRSFAWAQDVRRPPETARPDDSQPRESIETHKRKRTDDGDAQNHDQREHHHGSLSPKRRAAIDPSLRGPASDTTSKPSPPDHHRYSSDHERHLVGRSSREPSPVLRNTAPSLPMVRPETERHLAASVQRELQRSPERSPPQHAQASSPTYSQSGFHGNDQTSQSPDNSLQHQHLDENKKRKRMFSNRTKTGCHTCRARKKKCDERKPICQNCERGGFTCGGYGAKPPPGSKAVGAAQKQPVHLQSKQHLENPHYPHGPPPGYQYMPPPPGDGPRYTHWGRVEPPHPSQVPPEVRHDPYPPQQPQSQWQQAPPGAQWPPPPPPPPHPDYHSQRSLYPPNPPPSHPPPPILLPPDRPPHEQPQHITPYSQPPALLPPPPPLLSDTPWPNRPEPAGDRRHTSIYSSGSSGSAYRGMGPGSAWNERYYMLIGQPFAPYTNNYLLSDRQACQSALERYNSAADSRTGISAEERGRFFRAIVEPAQRHDYHRGRDPYNGPAGKVGHHTIVETPFHCDYGYNINLGANVVIQSGCKMQDPCEIRVGDRTIIGPNVKFYGMTANADYNKRKGTRGDFVGGAIFIGEDCFIGGDVIILPFRKIGRGSVVGAGAVVTKDVPEYTVVAGNPAKVIRRIDNGTVKEHASHDIQQQNERMLQDMRDSVNRQIESQR